MVGSFSESAGKLREDLDKKSTDRDKEILRDLSRREIIESTSFYLKGIIERSMAAHDGQVDVDDIIDTIKLEGKSAVFMPASIFADAEDLVNHYDTYLDMAFRRSAKQVGHNDRVRIAKAYLDQIEKARQDGRYFGRNSLEYLAEYGSQGQASTAARKFLKKHGYELNDRAADFSKRQYGRDPILEWGHIADHIKLIND